MSTLDWLLSNSLLESTGAVRLSLALVHFLWQGCAIAGTAWLAGWLLQRSSAALRYWLQVAALLAMAACVPATFAVISSPDRGPDFMLAGSPRDPARETRNGARVLQPIVARQRTTAVLELPDAADTALSETDATDRGAAEQRPVARQKARATVPATAVVIASPWLMTLYFIGAAIMLLRLTRSMFSGHRLRRVSTVVEDEALLVMLARQAKRVGLKTVPALAYCHRVAVPTVIGVLKPVILLPPALAIGLLPQQLEALLAHELAHIRRFDLAVNLAQRLVEALLFFHPAVWFISRRVSIERENAADDMVLAAGWQRTNYADSLVRMAELSAVLRNTKPFPQPTTLAASGTNASDFKRRVLRLLESGDTPHLQLTRSGILIMMFAAASLLITPVVVLTRADNGVSQVSPLPATDKANGPARLQPTSEPSAPKENEPGASIDVQVFDIYGQPVERSTVFIYRALSEDQAAEKDDWQDPATEQRWRPQQGKHAHIRPTRPNTAPIDGTTRISGLPAGTYRLVASSGGQTATPLGVSDVIRLDAKENKNVTLRMAKGGAVRFEVVDASNGKPLDRPSVWMAATPPTTPPGLIGLPIRDHAVSTFEYLQPGKYEFTIEQDALSLNEPEYDVQKRIVEVTDGDTQRVQVALAGRPLTDPEIKTRWPYVVTGTVTDANGKPIQAATVVATDGTDGGFPWAPNKLFYWGRARTDERGRYTLRFRGNGGLPKEGKRPFHAEEMLIMAVKDGLAERNANRHDPLRYAWRTPTTTEKASLSLEPGELVLPGQPRRMDFVMVPQVEVTVELLNAKGLPEQGATVFPVGDAMPPLNDGMIRDTNAAGTCVFSQLAPARAFSFNVRKQSGDERTPALKFTVPGSYTVRLATRVDRATGLDRFQVVSITATDGTEWKDRVVARVESRTDPAQAAVQQKGVALLKKLREVNRYWLGLPPREVKKYSYLFTTTGGGHRYGRVVNPATASLFERRGILYISAIDQLVRDLDNVTVTQLVVNDARITLEYELRVPFEVQISTGSNASKRRVTEGTLIIDRQTHTLLESKTRHVTEKLSQYIEIRPGHYVPRRISVSPRDTDLRFRVHRPGLWLFDRAFQSGNQTEAAAHIDHLNMNNVTLTAEEKALAAQERDDSTGGEPKRRDTVGQPQEPGAIPIRIRSRQFRDGDSITIDSLVERDSAPDEDRYEVRGRYRLESRPEALLEQWCAGGHVIGEKSVKIKKGEGEFRLTFSVLKKGSLHLSLYPIINLRDFEYQAAKLRDPEYVRQKLSSFASLYYEPAGDDLRLDKPRQKSDSARGSNANSPAASSFEWTIEETPFFRFHYSKDLPADADQVRRHLAASVKNLAIEFGAERVQPLLQSAVINVYAHPHPTDKAREGLATLETRTKDGAYHADLHILTPSAHGAGAKTSVGEPKDDNYFFKIVVHEYGTIVLDRMTQRKPRGWRFFSAPSWFVQGYEEYLGLMLSSEHNRLVTLQKYRDLHRAEPNRVSRQFDVRDAYIDGAVLLHFLHDTYGNKKVHALLLSAEPDFWSAVTETFGHDRNRLHTVWRGWLATQPNR